MLRQRSVVAPPLQSCCVLLSMAMTAHSKLAPAKDGALLERCGGALAVCKLLGGVVAQQVPLTAAAAAAAGRGDETQQRAVRPE